MLSYRTYDFMIYEIFDMDMKIHLIYERENKWIG